MSIRKEGLEWLSQRGDFDREVIKVSKLYEPSESRTRKRAWWFVFSEDLVRGRNFEPLNLLCQKSQTKLDFFHLRIPMGVFSACREALGHRDGKFWLFISADKPEMFREVNGDGQINFAMFKQ